MHRREPGFLFMVKDGFPFPEMKADVHVKDPSKLLELGANDYLVEGVIVKLDGSLPVLATDSDTIDTNYRVVVKDGLTETATLRFSDNWKFETNQFEDGVVATLNAGDKVKCVRGADDATTGEPRFYYSKAGTGETAVGVVVEKRANGAAIIKCPAA